MNFENLCKVITDQGGKPRSYSGRFMYGEYCVGVYMRHPGEYALPKGHRLDNLGLGIIAYWPAVKWKED